MYLRSEITESGWTIVDTDFVIDCKNVSVWECIVREYEKRNLNVVKTLITAISKWHHYSYSDDKTYVFRYVLDNTPNIEPYRTELEKYLILM